ncbi:MAG: acyl-CoA dehydrogenase family protein [Polyangiaceae bacterium]|nr:acyl-CoA dehydrogenase family protein [Polyangiaceae bacterium]
MSQPDELEAFRARAREWLLANVPARPSFKLPQTFLEVEAREQLEWLRDWQRRLYDAGYLGFDVPEEYGGRGVDRERRRVVTEELVRARAPFLVNFIGLEWAGPTILTFGTEAQKRRMLPPLLRGDELWCQGFSEPAAGSDLASLQTRAVRQADGTYRVTGHKVWTTVAHFASWMILLARTDPAANKYAGISYFLFPMDATGVTVEPLLKMTGEGGFNQVLFDDAPSPADSLLGEEGQGWTIAMTTLTFERGAAETHARERAAALLAQLGRVVELAREREREGAPALADPVLADRIAQLWIECAAIGLSMARTRAPALNAERPFALPLMNKLVSSEWNQRLAELATELLGADAALWLDDPRAPHGGDWTRGYMNSFGMTIGGGTSEILRNVIGERVLGLPKGK